MDSKSLLKVLQKSGRQSFEDLAEEFNCRVDEIAQQIQSWEQAGIICGYQAIVDSSKTEERSVTAFIEVKLTPELGGGFDRLAVRIAKFDDVKSCYLMSGGHDLIVVVTGSDLMEVAQFVSEKLSPMQGVLSTATHFRLKIYKENGFLFFPEEEDDRLPVVP